jgi:hypothetical protein
MCAPDIPDPIPAEETSAAATSTNVGTAIANTIMGNYDQYTPGSTTTFDQTGSYQWSDPFTGNVYDIPTFSQTTQYSPEEYAIYGQNELAKFNLSTLAAQQSGALTDLMSASIDTSGLPKAGTAAGLYDPTYKGYQSSAGLKNSFDAGGDITKSYGPEDGYSADRQRVEDALMQRLNPYLQQDSEALYTKLANQGLQAGSEAYDRALGELRGQQTDARLAVIGSAGDEQQRLNDMAYQQATFGNSAQQQAFNQNQGLAQFYNYAQQQGFDNSNSFASQSNALEQQKLSDSLTNYNAQNTDRSNALNELFALRQEPINEITALLSGSQVAAPNFQPASVATIPTTDTAGLMQAEYDAQVQKAMAEYSAQQSLLGGLFGLGAAMIK